MIDKRIVTHGSPKSAISESYRVIRSNIQFSSPDKNIKSILVTSSGPSEGKSVTISNVAVTFAQSGSKVILIDADLRKPNIHKIMGVNNREGLTNVLSEHKDYRIITQDSEVNNLFVLPSGPIPPNPSEILGSQAMKKFMEEVYNVYDVVLIDSPPVGVVTDAQILSTLVDATLLVAAAKNVTIDALKRAKTLLYNVNANVIGIILNKAKNMSGEYYYYSDDEEENIKRK